jgi:hypothetical protein
MRDIDKPQNPHFDAEMNEVAIGANSMTRRRFLTVLAAVGASPFMTTIGCSSVHHGFAKLSETDIPTTNQVMMGGALIHTNDGGYFAAFVCMSDLDFCWFDGQGNLVREIKQNLGPWPLCALQTKDGSIFVAGRGCTNRSVWGLPKELPDEKLRNWPYLQKMDATGKALPYNIQIPYKELWACSINQLLEVEDGVIFIGSKFILTPKEIPGKPLNKDVRVASPWIFKVLSDGAIAWQYVMTVDQGDYITVEPLDGVAEPPIVDAQGNITVIFKGREFVKETSGSYGVPIPINDMPFRTIAVKIDPSGNVLANTRIFNSTPLCIAYKAGQYSLLTATTKSFTVYKMDEQLKVIEQFPVTGGGEFVPYYAVPGVMDNELILYGDEGGAHATLASMDKEGKISSLMHLGSGSTLRGMAAGNSPGEVAILYTPSAGIPPFQRVASSGMVFARYRQLI